MLNVFDCRKIRAERDQVVAYVVAPCINPTASDRMGMSWAPNQALNRSVKTGWGLKTRKNVSMLHVGMRKAEGTHPKAGHRPDESFD